MRPSFVRFVSHHLDPNSHRRQGLFQASTHLEEARVLPPPELEQLHELEKWFRQHLPCPRRLSRSRRSGAHPEAICWFRSTALEHLRRMRELAALLERHGMPTVVLVTRRPGYVVYEDELQVVAVPFRETAV